MPSRTPLNSSMTSSRPVGLAELVARRNSRRRAEAAPCLRQAVGPEDQQSDDEHKDDLHGADAHGGTSSRRVSSATNLRGPVRRFNAARGGRRRHPALSSPEPLSSGRNPCKLRMKEDTPGGSSASCPARTPFDIVRHAPRTGWVGVMRSSSWDYRDIPHRLGLRLALHRRRRGAGCGHPVVLQGHQPSHPTPESCHLRVRHPAGRQPVGALRGALLRGRPPVPRVRRGGVFLFPWALVFRSSAPRLRRDAAVHRRLGVGLLYGGERGPGVGVSDLRYPKLENFSKPTSSPRRRTSSSAGRARIRVPVHVRPRLLRHRDAELGLRQVRRGPLRHGGLPPTPRQCDLMIVAGPAREDGPGAAAPVRPDVRAKWVISMGACATSGGPFYDGYNVVTASTRSSRSTCTSPAARRARRPSSRAPRVAEHHPAVQVRGRTAREGGGADGDGAKKG